MTSFDELLKSFEELEASDADMQALRNKVQAGNITVAVMALMKAGKSTLLNAMIGQEFCPATVEPQTATLLRIQHDPNYPDGKLTDADGITIAEGREQILNKIVASNADRRNAVQQEADLAKAAAQHESAASMPTQLLDGTYCTKIDKKKRSVVSVHRMLSQTGVVVVLSRYSEACKLPTQYVGKLMKVPSVGVPPHWVSRVLCLRENMRQYKLDLWMTANGIDFQLQEVARRGVDAVTVILRQEAVKQDAPARLLRARCIDGESVENYFCIRKIRKGVRCNLNRQACRNDSSGWREVGDEFAVSSFVNDSIQDHEGYWLKLCSTSNKVQFLFLQGDAQQIVPGEQVFMPYGNDMRNMRPATVVHVDRTASVCYSVRLDSSCGESCGEADVVKDVPYVELQPPSAVDSQEGVASEAAEDHLDELTRIKMDFFDSTKAYTLFVPVESFASCSELNTAGLILMDTPGPNEAHAGLKMELKVALAAADVVIYLIDYTKLGTKDEVDLLTQIYEECGDVLAKDSSRFWFVLNKVDTKKAEVHTEDIRKTVAAKMSSLRKDITISPKQILPISAQEAYLARQASKSRWEIDTVFRNEFEARLVGKASAELLKGMCSSEEEYWKLVQEKCPPIHLKTSNFASFEDQVLVGVTKSKDRIVREKVCDSSRVSSCKHAELYKIEIGCTARCRC